MTLIEKFTPLLKPQFQNKGFTYIQPTEYNIIRSAVANTIETEVDDLLIKSGKIINNATEKTSIKYPKAMSIIEKIFVDYPDSVKSVINKINNYLVR